MSISTINQLLKEYTAEDIVCKKVDKEILVDTFICSRGLFAAGNHLTLSAKEHITILSPGSLAGKFVSLVSSRISLGMDEMGKYPATVRVHAEELLSLSADEITIGDLELLGTPKRGFVTCTQLNLIRSLEGSEPASFKFLYEWVNKGARIVVITPDMFEKNCSIQ